MTQAARVLSVAALEELRAALCTFGSQAKEMLGISNQAMSQRLSAAGWQAEGPGRSLAVELLTEAGAE